MSKKRIAIVGAGLAGLNAAKILQNQFDIHLYDRSSEVGGRLQSDQVEGYTLDHGFQVLLTNYPEAKRAFKFEDLSLSAFLPGAILLKNNKQYKIGDPFRWPSSFLETIIAPIGSIKDKLLILKLRTATPGYNYSQSTSEYLSQFGFSKKIIDSFFTPFFSGVFLDRELKESSEFFKFLYNRFASGSTCLPNGGMQSLALNLKEQCKNVEFHLDANVEIIDANEISINGKKEFFDIVIKAYADDSDVQFNSVTTDYFSCPIEAVDSKALYLVNDKNRMINHIACLASVNKNYAPAGKQLLSVNLLGEQENASVEDVQRELSLYFPHTVLKHLKRYQVKHALPMKSQFGSKEIQDNGVYLCGDYMESPSINGALLSGRKVAEYLLA